MTIKKILVRLGILMICGILLICFIQTKIPLKNITNVDSLASLQRSSSLETWVGEYSFSEYAPPNQNMFYSITIYCKDDNYFAKIYIDGFQKSERLSAKVSGDVNFIKLEFLKYLPDNMLEPYKKGDTLLIFEKVNSKMITNWEKIQPLLLQNKKVDEYFKLTSADYDSKCSK